MALLQDLLPMHWPSGPLEIAKRQKAEGFTPEAKQTLERWHQPAALDILKDTPVSCLVLSWAAGLPEDSQQWKTAAPLVDAARQRGLAVVGWVEGTGDPNAAIAAAKSAGLAAIAVKGFKGRSDFPVLPWAENSKPDWDTKAPVLPVTGSVWPGVLGQRGGGATAGPTSTPWVESNGWYVQLAQARTAVPLWLMFDPPPAGNVVRAQSYNVAISDTEAAGGRWVLSLDANLRAGLVQGDSAARQTLSGISGVLRFFEKHREWKSYRPIGLVGVISDFAAQNFDVSGEVLKLTARRGLLSRPLWKSRLGAQGLAGSKALVYFDNQPPAAALRKQLMAFVEQGGVLFTAPKWGPEGIPAGADTHPRFELRSLGKGRLAVAREDLADPYQAAVDIQGIFSRANDLVRLFNSPTSGCIYYTASPDGKKALLQLLNYSGGAGGGGGVTGSNVTVWVKRSYRSARLWAPDQAEPIVLKALSEGGGYEYHIDKMPPFMALELEV